MLEKTLQSPLDCKEIQQVHFKGNQSWIFIGKTDAEAETPILWPPDAKNQLIGKDPNAGKDWRWKEKGTTEDEMVGWMASPTRWTWVWVRSGSWWWTGKPGVLQSMGSQRVRHDWVTELNHSGELVNGYKGLLCTVSYKCLWIYHDLKVQFYFLKNQRFHSLLSKQLFLFRNTVIKNGLS